MLKFLGTLFLLALLAAGAAFWLVNNPYGPSSETFVEVAPGTSTHAIAVQMARAGVIRSQYAFALLRIFQGVGGTLKAGEYRFDHPATPAEVYSRLQRGDVYTIGLTIPEGYNIFDVAQAVQAASIGEPKITAEVFLAAERQHTELVAPWFPQGTRPASLEGYLFPDTYQFSRHSTPLQMLATMVRRFRQETTQLGLTTDVPRTIIMASLIEKEVKQDDERPLVAGVFLNRLSQGMPLATDPTVIYAALLDNRWRGTIYASDLQNLSPYNTYRHAGLPPGPICNPGVAALKAAISPALTDYLYFVADAAGHTRFSRDLKEHSQQVQAYRQAQHGR